LQLTGASAGEDFHLVEELSVLVPVKETADADEIFFTIGNTFK
jgi:hypothetical protein